MSQPESTKVGDSRRVVLIDLCRGILFLLMCSSHTLSVAKLESPCFFRDHWLPIGWSSSSFIGLSGFSIGFLFFAKYGDLLTRHKLLRRAKQIAIVMFVSNLVMLLAKHATSGTLAVAAESSWWMGLFTFRTPYSISAILIPTSLLLFVAPWLLRLCKCSSRTLMCFWVFEIGLLFSCAAIRMYLKQADYVPHVLDVLFVEGIGGFQIVACFLVGVYGFVLGVLWRRRDIRRIAIMSAAVVVLAFLANGLLSETSGFSVRLTNTALFGVSRFTILLLLAWGLARFSWAPLRVLSLIGKHSLFTFLLHRVIIQAMFKGFRLSYPTGGREFAYLGILISTLGLLYLLCWIPHNGSLFSAMLRRLHLSSAHAPS